MSLVQRTAEFLKEVRIEVPKVSWPSRRELRDSALGQCPKKKEACLLLHCHYSFL